MKKKTKPGAIQQLLSYAGNNKKQLYLSTFLATLGELFGMAPFITVSLLVAELFNKTATIQNVCILFAVALGGQILKLWLTYQSSFMSHKATYKILKNIRSMIADKMLRAYKGMYCMESFNPLGVQWYRKNHPELVRGQLSDAFLKEGEYVGVLYFVLQNLLLNFVTKPDFVAYNHHYPEILSRKLCRGLYHNTAAAWTIKSQQELDEARKHFDIFIFDSFVPEARK